jgi:putative flippase GtrA
MVKRIRTEFMQFLLVGGFAAAVNFFCRIALSEIMSFRWAVFVAYLFGMLTAFLLSKYFVFEKSGKHHLHELRDFTIVNILAVIQVWLISVSLAEYLFPAIEYDLFANELAHFIGLMIPAITSYLGHKHFSFKKI